MDSCRSCAKLSAVSMAPFGGCSFSLVEGYPGDNDELFGRRTLAFTAEELATAMPNVNDTFVETIKRAAA